MYTNVHKELESLITRERLSTCTRIDKHMFTLAARQQVEPVRRSRAASESHSLVKLASDRQQTLFPRKSYHWCLCMWGEKERERGKGWETCLIDGESLYTSRTPEAVTMCKSRPCSCPFTLIFSVWACVSYRGRETAIFVNFPSRAKKQRGRRRWGAEGNLRAACRPNKAAPHRLSAYVFLYLPLFYLLSPTTHSNSLDEAASSFECVSFLPSCW